MTSTNQIVRNAIAAMNANPYSAEYRAFKTKIRQLGNKAAKVRLDFVKDALRIDDKTVADAKKEANLTEKYAIFSKSDDDIHNLFSKCEDDHSKVIGELLSVPTVDHDERVGVLSITQSCNRNFEGLRKWINDGKGENTWRELKTPKFMRLGHL